MREHQTKTAQGWLSRGENCQFTASVLRRMVDREDDDAEDDESGGEDG